MAAEKIVRRETPLVGGMKIQMCVVTYYDIDVEEYLSGEESVTLSEIEQDIGGKYRSTEQMALSARRGDLGDPTVGDVVFTIDVRDPEWGTSEARFETEYEAKNRSRSHNKEFVEVPGGVS